jgi:hypothetical protein
MQKVIKANEIEWKIKYTVRNIQGKISQEKTNKEKLKET